MKRELDSENKKRIKQYIVDFFKVDIGCAYSCRINDLVIDEEYDEAYADIHSGGVWYSAYLQFEKRSNLNIIPTNFILNEYKGVV